MGPGHHRPQSRAPRRVIPPAIGECFDLKWHMLLEMRRRSPEARLADIEMPSRALREPQARLGKCRAIVASCRSFHRLYARAYAFGGTNMNRRYLLGSSAASQRVAADIPSRHQPCKASGGASPEALEVYNEV